MKGVEFLRGLYASSGLSIRPKTKLSKIEQLKTIIEAWGMDPNKILSKEALAMPHRTVIDPQRRQSIDRSAVYRIFMDRSMGSTDRMCFLAAGSFAIFSVHVCTLVQCMLNLAINMPALRWISRGGSEDLGAEDPSTWERNWKLKAGFFLRLSWG